MEARFQDVPYYTFSYWSDMVVVCPACGKAGVVCFDKKRGIARFQCGGCCAKKERQCAVFQDIRHAEDPYFRYPLYFQASYRGKRVWALNREHLQYLIDYLAAGIRTVQPGYYEAYKTMRTQSDMLPSFLKSAKNRDGVVKLLTKLQRKC